MERLTEWSKNGHGQLVFGDVYTRLAEYEDTGMTPEEINELKLKYDEMIAVEATSFDDSIFEFVEYQKAKSEGRIVTLPIALNSEVFQIVLNIDACYHCEHYRDPGYGYDSVCKNPDVKSDDDTDVLVPTGSDLPLCEKHYFVIKKKTVRSFSDLDVIMNSWGTFVFGTLEEAENQLKILNDKWRIK